ncbi:hypothetical protein Tco_0215955 [Tanacetum coccineum]
MASHRSKSLYAIKECSTCGSLYTKDCCSIGNLNDKILVSESDSSPCCARCGTPVDGPSCRGCAFLRKKFDEDLLAYCVENGIFKDFQNTSESSDNNTNVVNALREPCVVNQDPGLIKEITNDLGIRRFRGEEIDEEYERDCEITIHKLKQDFNVWGSEVRKKEKAYEDEKYAAACRYMLSVTCDVLRETCIPIPSEFEGISDDSCDVPTCDNNRINVESDFVESLVNRDTLIDNSSKIDPILEEFAGELAHIAPIPPGIVEADFDPNDDTSSDDDDFEDIEYISLEEVEQEEKKFDLEDILQIHAQILLSITSIKTLANPLLAIPAWHIFAVTASMIRGLPILLAKALIPLVWICQISQEISQKRTRERMSDQEAKELKAEAREIMPQPSTACYHHWKLDGCYGIKRVRAIGQLIAGNKEALDDGLLSLGRGDGYFILNWWSLGSVLDPSIELLQLQSNKQ